MILQPSGLRGVFGHPKQVLTMTKDKKSEHEEQKAVIDWADLHIDLAPPLDWLNSSLNGIVIPGDPRTRARIVNYMKAEGGFKAGISDLNLPAARRGYHSLYIELKKTDGKESDIREGQIEFMAYLESEGYLGVVCFGATSAIDQLKWYLDIDCGCLGCQISAGL